MPTINKGSDYFGVLTYTGDGAASKTVVDTNAVSFTPDFVWIKGRSGATDHALYDAVRGTTKDLVSNSTAAETTQSTGLTAFTNGGFTIGNLAKLNTSGATYTAWCWKANGAGSSNTSGSITSTVSVNTTAGFSVVTWANTSTNATIGHGLGVAPKMIIAKNRTGTADSWLVYHSALGATKFLRLESTAAEATNIVVWNNTAPTSSVFSIGTGLVTGNFVAYCWAEIAGFSKFGSYTGNGSADGPFVYTGFRPKFLMFKTTTIIGHWVIVDTSRNTYNVIDNSIYPDTAGSEINTITDVDFLSNGFKWRGVLANETNVNGEVYIYMAFAESPFSSNNRAR